MMEKGFYVTTPIYYVNARPHLGHAYATILADTLARYNRLRGRETMFLTGADEHGQKLENAARDAGKTPQEFVDEIVKTFKGLWRELRLSNDDFIRTTEPRHEKVVRDIFQRLYDGGDIYKGHYEGWYCTPCESYWTEPELLEGNVCPSCKRPTSMVKEESYFFRLSKYRDALLNFYNSGNPGFIVPQSKRQEVVNRIEAGLEDISVSRSTVKWGVPVPFDEGHTVYVWFDALINYVSALGFPDKGGKFGAFWPADYHVIGKDIMWFHGVIWPAMLMALGEEPPRHLLVTGFWLQGEDKMSKSKGNVTDPLELANEYGIDALRYFFMREMALGQDASFSVQALVSRLNADLANDFGNLLHRTGNLVNKFLGGRMPDAEGDAEVLASLEKTAAEFGARMDECRFRDALDEIWRFIRSMNKYVDDKKPWALAKTDAGAMEKALATVLETVRSVSILASPILPNTAERVFGQLSLEWDGASLRWDEALKWGTLRGRRIVNLEPLFPRIQLD